MSDGPADLEDEDTGHHHSRDGWSGSKMGGYARKRQEARDQLVDKIRSYGVLVLGALVLLPPQLVAVLALVGGIVHLALRGVRNSMTS